MQTAMGSDKRTFKREKHRAGCEFRIDGGAMHAGIVADVSARGLYVQSSFIPEEGASIELIVRRDGVGDLPISGRVSRLKKSHRAATSVVQGGFGVEVDSAPEGFFQLLVDLGLG